MSKIALMGAGGFGTALAISLSKVGNSVTLWDRDKDHISRWQQQGFSDRYPFLESVRFPEILTLSSSDMLDASKFDFVIISTSLSGLKPVLGCINNVENAPLVLIQKGMFPGLISATEAVLESFPKAKVLQFTGAAFAKDLVTNSPVGMIVSHETKHQADANQFANLFKGTGIWVTQCTDQLGINIHNTLRTIASFEQGLIYGYFANLSDDKKPPISTIAITFAAIGQEIKQIAQLLGATKEIHDIESKVFRIIEADLMLCQNDSSRNFALGHFMGLGSSLSKAKNQVTEGVSECVSNVKTIVNVFYQRKLGKDLEKNFPYLFAAFRLLNRKEKIENCIKDILAHHENYAA